MIDLHIHSINWEKLNIDLEKYKEKLDFWLILWSKFPNKLKKNELNNSSLLKIIENNLNLYWLISFGISKYCEKEINFLKNNKILWIKFYTGYYKYFYHKNIENYIKKSLEFNKNIFLFHTWFCNTKDKNIFDVKKLESLFDKFSNWKFIIAHLWNPFFLDTIKFLKKYNNVYADISWIFWNWENIDLLYLRKLKFIFKIIENENLFDKILFWTDFPIIKLEEKMILLKKVTSINNIEKINYSTLKFITKYKWEQ